MKSKEQKRKLYKHYILSVLFIFGVSIIVGMGFHGTKLFSSFTYFFKYTSMGLALGFAFFLGHGAIGNYINKKLDWTKNLKKANIISLLMYIVYGVIVSITVAYLFSKYILIMSGEDLFLNVLIMSLMIIALDLIAIAIFYSTYLTKYWKKSIVTIEELKRESLIAKYEALKNQVNPHFLFNSLNTLSGVVEQKPEQASEFIKKLSDIYRYVLEQNDKELVPLQDEMKFVGDYIFLSKMRFGEALVFNSGLTNNKTIQVVPLGLQMLVENAIKHNIISDDMPLKIDIQKENGFFIMSNNVQPKKTIVSDKEPMGLENLKKRYAYFTDTAVEIVNSNSEFVVKLPVIEA